MSAFDALVSDTDYPMLLVTAAAGGERAGCLVGFATQSSIDPARFLICLSIKNRTYRVADRARALGVHLVPAAAGNVAELFGAETGDEVDKFAQVAWREGPEGVPLVEACPSWFAGRVAARLPCGDHEAFLLDVVAAEYGASAPLYTFRQARALSPGHEA
jgi:flavin reductase (DIM6/NTAB) family NADH-FMN oxidoreductase RutF